MPELTYRHLHHTEVSAYGSHTTWCDVAEDFCHPAQAPQERSHWRCRISRDQTDTKAFPRATSRDLLLRTTIAKKGETVHFF